MEYLQNLEFTSEVWIILVPLFLCILDVITGYTYAWINNEIKSAKMRAGLGKKLGELAYVLVGILSKHAFGVNSIMIFITFYICFMEIVSLAENCTKLGVPLPEKVKEKLNNNKED